MPPVAFGDSDPRRWGFQADSSEAEGVGVLGWPACRGLSTNLGVGGGGRVLAEENGGDVHPTSGASGSPGRLAVDEGERLPGPGFRDSPPDPRGRSPGPRPMDPRIIVDANSIVGGSNPGGNGVGPPSRQGSPFSRSFDAPPTHQHQAGSVDSSPGLGGGASYGVARMHHQMTSAPSARGGAGPPRHRPAFEDSIGIPPASEQLYGMSPGSENPSQGGDSTGRIMLGGLGGGRTSMGAPAGPHSLGSGGVSRVAQQPPHGVGGAPVAWHGQGHQPQAQQQQQPRHAQQQQQPQQQQQTQQQPQLQQPQHQQHRQQQHHRQQGRPGSSAPDDGLVRRVGGNGGVGGPWVSTVAPNEDSMSMSLASVPHGASSLPAAAVPTVLERFPGFVRCVMDIAPEVVGWVIGRSGAHIKEMKHRSGCGMWVDQKDLKLYITGADMPRIHAAARLVGDLISKAPVNVNSAGVEDEVTSHMIECPPHLIGLLIGRGGSTIKRIKEESRANVVINQKMMKVIVSGIPQSVRLGVAMIEDVITFGRSAEHSNAGMGSPGTFLDFPDAFSMGSIGGIGDYDDGAALDRFIMRASPSMSGGGRLAPPPPPFAGGPSNLGGGGGGSLPSVAFSGGGSFDGLSRQHRAPPTSGLQHQGSFSQQQQQQESGASGSTMGSSGKSAETGFDGKDTDWSIFSLSSQMFNIGSEGQLSQSQQQQSQQQQQQQSAGGQSSPTSRSVRGHAHAQMSGLPPSAGGSAPRNERDNSGSVERGGSASHARSASSSGPAMGIAPVISRSGSVSSGSGTPPLAGRSAAAVAAATAAKAAAPWSIISTPLRGEGGSRGGGGTVAVAGGSPSAGVSLSGTLQSMQRLSISSLEDSCNTGQSLGQASRQRERAGTPVGNPVDLVEFLGGMELGQYAQVLMDNEIDLEAVQLMADTDFQDIGIPKGPRVKMLYALRTNRHPPRSGDLSALRTFLTSLGLERYCKAFEDAEVDMSAVDVMEESDYAELGVAKGPRLKMMNVLAKAAGSFNSGSVGAASTGSNTGSAFSVSPELRHSPPPPQGPSLATSNSGNSSFPVSNMVLGATASTLPPTAVTLSPGCASGSSASCSASSRSSSIRGSESPRSRAPESPDRARSSEEENAASSLAVSAVEAASVDEACSAAGGAAMGEGECEGGDGNGQQLQPLPPSWDETGMKNERSSGVASSMEAWMASAMDRVQAEAEAAETGATSASDDGVRSL